MGCTSNLMGAGRFCQKVEYPEYKHIQNTSGLCCNSEFKYIIYNLL